MARKAEVRTVTVHGMEGTGRTVAVAKANAAAKLERLVSDIVSPPYVGFIPAVPGVTPGLENVQYIVWRDEQGWTFNTLRDYLRRPRQGDLRGMSGGDCGSREAAICAAVRSIFSWCWTIQVEDDEALIQASVETVTFDVGIPARDSLADDLRREVAFQRLYRIHEAAGATDSQARRAACDESYTHLHALADLRRRNFPDAPSDAIAA